MHAKLFAATMAVVVFLFIVELIRRQKMTFKYSLFWLGTSFLVLVLAFNENLLGRLSELAGFSLPSNFVFFLVMLFFIFLSLALTIYVNEQNIRTDTLAQHLALLELEFKKFQQQSVQRKHPL